MHHFLFHSFFCISIITINTTGIRSISTQGASESSYFHNFLHIFVHQIVPNLHQFMVVFLSTKTQIRNKATGTKHTGIHCREAAEHSGSLSSTSPHTIYSSVLFLPGFRHEISPGTLWFLSDIRLVLCLPLRKVSCWITHVSPVCKWIYLTLYLNNSEILLLMFKTSSTFTAYHTYLCFEMVSRKPKYIYVCIYWKGWHCPWNATTKNH